ncbi:MAG: BON domain-containing protein [Chloroflexi bacterium]|nr:BON domain-containing protein [Chloroflexota bacterium]
MQNKDVDKRRVRKVEELEEQLRASDELPYDEAVDDGPIVEVSLEELYEEAIEADDDLDVEDLASTKYTDGSTNNPQEAWEQGLVYTPPDDPPVIMGDDPQRVEMAAGFAQSMEATDTDYDRASPRMNDNDLDLEDEIQDALRYSSETAQLDLSKLEVHVNNGVVYLYGFVETDDDIAVVDYLLRDVDGVVRVENFLEVEDPDNDVEA